MSDDARSDPLTGRNFLGGIVLTHEPSGCCFFSQTQHSIPGNQLRDAIDQLVALVEHRRPSPWATVFTPE